VTVTTLSAGYLNIVDNFWPLTTAADPSVHMQGYVNSICTAIMMLCAVVILGETGRRSLGVLSGRVGTLETAEAEA
jgi:hypothetical protein